MVADLDKQITKIDQKEAESDGKKSEDLFKDAISDVEKKKSKIINKKRGNEIDGHFKNEIDEEKKETKDRLQKQIDKLNALKDNQDANNNLVLSRTKRNVGKIMGEFSDDLRGMTNITGLSRKYPDTFGSVDELIDGASPKLKESIYKAFLDPKEIKKFLNQYGEGYVIYSLSDFLKNIKDPTTIPPISNEETKKQLGAKLVPKNLEEKKTRDFQQKIDQPSEGVQEFNNLYSEILSIDKTNTTVLEADLRKKSQTLISLYQELGPNRELRDKTKEALSYANEVKGHVDQKMSIEKSNFKDFFEANGVSEKDFKGRFGIGMDEFQTLSEEEKTMYMNKISILKQTKKDTLEKLRGYLGNNKVDSALAELDKTVYVDFSKLITDSDIQKALDKALEQDKKASADNPSPALIKAKEKECINTGISAKECKKTVIDTSVSTDSTLEKGTKIVSHSVENGFDGSYQEEEQNPNYEKVYGLLSELLGKDRMYKFKSTRRLNQVHTGGSVTGEVLRKALFKKDTELKPIGNGDKFVSKPEGNFQMGLDKDSYGGDVAFTKHKDSNLTVPIALETLDPKVYKQLGAEHNKKMQQFDSNMENLNSKILELESKEFSGEGLTGEEKRELLEIRKEVEKIKLDKDAEIKRHTDKLEVEGYRVRQEDAIKMAQRSADFLRKVGFDLLPSSFRESILRELKGMNNIIYFDDGSILNGKNIDFSHGLFGENTIDRGSNGEVLFAKLMNKIVTGDEQGFINGEDGEQFIDVTNFLGYNVEDLDNNKVYGGYNESLMRDQMKRTGIGGLVFDRNKARQNLFGDNDPIN